MKIFYDFSEVPGGYKPVEPPFIISVPRYFRCDPEDLPREIRDESEREFAAKYALETGNVRDSDAILVGPGRVEIVREPEGGYSCWGKAIFYFPIVLLKKPNNTGR